MNEAAEALQLLHEQGILERLIKQMERRIEAQSADLHTCKLQLAELGYLRLVNAELLKETERLREELRRHNGDSA